MTVLDAVEEVLRSAGEPLHFKSITDRILESGLWQTSAKTPSNTVSTSLSDDLATNGGESRFRRVKAGVYDLNDRRVPAQTPKQVDPVSEAAETKLTFTDAAERILRENDGQEPLHYKEVTRRIVARGLFKPKAANPSYVLNAGIGREIQRRHEANEPQRFVRPGRGLIGLASLEPRVVRQGGPGERRGTDSEVVSGPSKPLKRVPMTTLDAAAEVLRDAGEPLHIKSITDRMLESGLWQSQAKVPHHSVSGCVTEDIASKGKDSKFRRVRPGVYGLNVPDSPDPTAEPSNQPRAAPVAKLSYTDAAERVLRENDGQQPLHYKEIARRMLDLKLVETRAVTPAYTLNAAVGDEIRRRQEANKPQRFVRLGRGLIGLAAAEPEGVRKAIDKENRQVRVDLLSFLQSIDPIEFEHVVRELISAMGAESPQVTRGSGDGGVDVRGTLLVGGAIPIKIAAQVKRWKGNVGRPIVNELRGGLLPDETGLIVTTSRFTAAAKDTARTPGLAVITLIDGDALVDLMVEHEIWVSRQQHDLLTLATPSTARSTVSG